MAVMVGNKPNATVVPLASSTLLTNLPMSQSVFQCTLCAGGVSLTALLAHCTKRSQHDFESSNALRKFVDQQEGFSMALMVSQMQKTDVLQ